MPFKVIVTGQAEFDLNAIDDYIATHDSPAAAEHVIGELARVIRSLQSFPERGTVPGELASLGVKQYRQVFFKPYRVVYTVAEGRVFVVLVADGRRDMKTLLSERLLGER
jgi:toxin ParE1/3/4